jgi:shikimate dehydrogenase
VNRNPDRGQALVNLINDRTGADASFVQWEGKYQVPEGTDLLLNATPIGLYPDLEALVPVDPDALVPHLVVSDVVPNPPRTRFLRQAEARGCTVLDGLGMLVNQGVIGIRLWTEREPDAAVMRRALESIFA